MEWTQFERKEKCRQRFLLWICKTTFCQVEPWRWLVGKQLFLKSTDYRKSMPWWLRRKTGILKTTEALHRNIRMPNHSILGLWKDCHRCFGLIIACRAPMAQN